MAGRVKVRTDWPAVMVTTSGAAGAVVVVGAAVAVVGGWEVVGIEVGGTVVETSAAVALVVGPAARCSGALSVPEQPASSDPANSVQNKPIRCDIARNVTMLA